MNVGTSRDDAPGLALFDMCDMNIFLFMGNFSYILALYILMFITWTFFYRFMKYLCILA